MRKIVVGADGSDASRSAVAWAIEEARAHAATLILVHAFEHVPLWQLQDMDGFASVDSDLIAQEDAAARTELEHQAQALLDSMTDGVGSDVAIECIVRSDRRPAAALVELSASADLLVVGSRGLGGVRGALLGSVSQHCVTNARCPVVVLNPEASHERRPAS